MNKDPKSQHRLGIFDSGVGGFSVYRAIRSVSEANSIYYGDTARAPYGNRDETELRRFIIDDIRFLQDEDVNYFVNACNSMSVMTTDSILKECGISSDHYTDMIRAFRNHATFEASDLVLVFATLATIRSGVYQEVIVNKGARVLEYIFRDLAGAIEANAKEDELLLIIEDGMVFAKNVGATHIVHGCTHYSLISNLFTSMQQKVGWNGKFIDPAVYVAQEVALWKLTGTREFTPYSSKDTPAFIKYVAQLLN